MPRRGRSSVTASAATSPKRRRTSGRFTSARTARDAALGGSDQAGRRIAISDSDFVEKNLALKSIDGTEGSELKASDLDLNLETNRKNHHTDDFEQEDLIVRRGQEFVLGVKFSRDYNKDADQIVLQLTTGNRPQESKDTLLRLKVAHHDDNNSPSNDDWYAYYRSSSETTVELGVMPPSDAIIGQYHIYVETVTKADEGGTFSHRREFEENFTLLFNAWCKEDSVYMEEEKDREEYILNDRGRIWTGTRLNNGGMPWNFGQFQEPVLEASLYLLEKAELTDGAKSNPTSIIRGISAIANSCDDRGMLTGRWTDDYPKNCTVPWAWTGSVGIISEYMKTKKSVQFGQCWVFSGLVTSLIRALGIPTRSITNFESAHDTDSSVTIDFHWNEDDEPESDYNDSVWNFHVWNESYFSRPDLPEGYAGWQSFDATPQEASEGVMQCGPVPVKAIKEGQLYIPFDAPFVFSEVNGDKVHWLIKKDGSMEYLSKEKNAIGQCISTKAVGSNFRNDVTDKYKYKEGSDEERAAVRRAFRFSSRRKHNIYDVPEPDVSFTLAAPDNVTIGEDFTLKVTMKNTSDEERNARVRLTAVASYYTGVPSDRVGTKVFEEKLAVGEETTCELLITADAYQPYLKPDSSVTVYMKGHVLETGKAYAKTDSFGMSKPKLTVEGPERVSIGESFDLLVKFTNPLSTKLTGGVLHVEAPRMMSPQVITIKKAISAGQEFTYTLENVSASRSGSREIFINFSADQLVGLTGSAEVYVSYS